jgi:hypothetical protein
MDRPDLDLDPVFHDLRAFRAWRDTNKPLTSPPSLEELECYLAECSTHHGHHSAAKRLRALQVAAPALWGVPYASMIAIIVRRHRCAPNPKGKSDDETVRALIARLPGDWQAGMIARMTSEDGHKKAKWSNAHLLAVTQALLRWLGWCESLGHDVKPRGTTFHAYACDLLEDGISPGSVGDYLGRILSGYSTAGDPGFESVACDHVVSRMNARAKTAGRASKTADQLVGASTIFKLGLEIVEGARALGPRGLHPARDYRNGLLLATAAAVPQRARALSHFDIGNTVVLLERPYIHVRLPGRALKLREYEKEHGGYDRVLKNADLWDAIEEYWRLFRPLFDAGTAMFPSLLQVDGKVSASQLGKLVGDLTEKHLGVRVSVHRVRDNVATEASEELPSGGYIAPALLDHRNPATTMASYDHAEGVRAAREHAEFVASRRSFSAKLRL